MPPIFRDDPYLRLNFLVEIAGVSDDPRATRGAFSEVSGLDVEIVPIEYRTGGEDTSVRKLPGLRKFTNIVLKRGVIGDTALWNWLKSAMQGQVQRTTLTIVLLDESRKEVMRWKVQRAWPCKWSGPELNAKANEVALESLEICHEGIELDT
jgi:phage tail-like protein